MYSLPQEIEVWYIIPVIRKEIAKVLTEKHKLTFEKAGKILGIGKAAISQYLSNKRAKKLKLPASVVNEIEKSADIIMNDNKKAVAEIGRILKMIKGKKCSCSLCREYNPEILNYCKYKSC